MRTGTRDKAVVQPVSPPRVEPKRGESYLVLWLVCAPASWRLSPGVLGVWAALASGLLFRFCLFVRSRRVLLAFLRRLVPSPGLFQRGYDPGHRPKDRVFPDRPTTCRAGSPWWPGMRGDDPRTDLLAGTPFYVQPYCGIHGGNWVLTLVFFVASSFFVFSSSARTHRRGLVEEPPRVERALSVEVVRLSFPLLLQFFRKVTHERRWFPWTLVSPISFV